MKVVVPPETLSGNNDEMLETCIELKLKQQHPRKIARSEVMTKTYFSISDSWG